MAVREIIKQHDGLKFCYVLGTELSIMPVVNK
jgi:hypothetical protein